MFTSQQDVIASSNISWVYILNALRNQRKEIAAGRTAMALRSLTESRLG
jgi:hypothetical protein